MANGTPDTKEKVIFWLESLIKLVRNDAIRAEDIKDLTADDVIALAEIEAQKAVDNAQALKDGN